MRERMNQKIIATLARFRDDEDGAALIKYTVLIGLTLVRVIATTDNVKECKRRRTLLEDNPTSG
jgi:Flp pilus assembly pilin Flp